MRQGRIFRTRAFNGDARQITVTNDLRARQPARKRIRLGALHPVRARIPSEEVKQFAELRLKGFRLVMLEGYGSAAGTYAIGFHRNDGAGTCSTIGFPHGTKTRTPSLANGFGWARRGESKERDRRGQNPRRLCDMD